MKLALIGFGGIGRIVAETLRGDPGVRFVAVAARAHRGPEVRDVLRRRSAQIALNSSG